MTALEMAGVKASATASAPATLDAEQALMLDILGQAPVMFHRAYVGVSGSINAGLWLSYAMGRRTQAIAAMQDVGQLPVGPVWFTFSRDECEEGTGLTRHQQDTARRDLRQREIVLEQRRTTNEVAINTRKLGQLLMQQSRVLWGNQITPLAAAAVQTLAQSDAGVTSGRAAS